MADIGLKKIVSALLCHIPCTGSITRVLFWSSRQSWDLRFILKCMTFLVLPVGVPEKTRPSKSRSWGSSSDRGAAAAAAALQQCKQRE